MNEASHSNANMAMTVIRFVILAIQLWLVAMVLILGTAFILGLLGANPEAGFSTWIYDQTENIMRPFAGIFEPIRITDGASIRLSLLFAMAVYGVACGALNIAVDRIQSR